MIIDSPTGITIRGLRPTDVNFSLSLVDRDRLISEGGGAGTATEDDAEFSTLSESSVFHEQDVIVQESVIGSLEDVEFESLDTDKGTIDQQGRITGVGSGGVVRILVHTKLLTKRADATIVLENPTPSRTFIGFVSGSLAEHCTDMIDSRILGQDASAKLLHNGTSYQSSCWAEDIDLTGLTREIPRGTLIAPDIIIGAEHYQPGASISFLKSDGTVVNATVSSRQNIGPANASDFYVTDIVVCRLSAPVDVTFFKLAPANWVSKFGFVSGADRVPCLSLDQEEKALVDDLLSVSSGRVNMTNPSDAQRFVFYENKISGDSGNPCFLIINGEAVLITTWTFGGAGSGPDYSANITAINSAMTSLGSAYQVTTADLSGFPTY